MNYQKCLTFILSFMISILLLGNNAAATPDKNLVELEKSLQKYIEQDFKDIAAAIESKKSTEQNNELNQKSDRLFKNAMIDLDKAISYLTKNNPPNSAHLVQLILTVQLYTFYLDPLESATENIYPLYQKNKKLFEQELNKLPSTKSKKIKESFQNLERELSSGNG